MPSDPHICLIWAQGRNRVIGAAGGLPWRLRKDLTHFMKTTLGKPVIMGRRTFESMKAPLPGRTNIVVTRNPAYRRVGIEIVGDFASAVALGRRIARTDGEEEVFVMGGADIYALGLKIATRLYVTHVDGAPAGDTYFPEVDWSKWRPIAEVAYAADDQHAYAFRIVTYEAA
ncbi:MAG: dihydrofolate reductase [Proteobacteria bacterium]|nr:dihydrofolate reductase [Pseudomonadota bacterium]